MPNNALPNPCCPRSAGLFRRGGTLAVMALLFAAAVGLAEEKTDTRVYENKLVRIENP